MARTLITGGAGYIGIELVDELLTAGREVTVLDVLLHDQADRAEELRERGVTVVEGDIRDPVARGHALHGADAVVHLAAIVGDPACARDPQLAQEVNVDASLALAAEAGDAGVERFVMARTCSNYGRMTDPTSPIDETGVLAPVSLYAEQKVAVEQHLLALDPAPFAVTCLRFATVYGVAPRMRFDLTVNEFTRDLWADQPLRGLRRAVLAPVRARPRRRARHPHRAARRRSSRWPARCSTSATRARTTASSTSWSGSASRRTAARVASCSAARTRATTRSRSRRCSGRSATRSPRPSRGNRRGAAGARRRPLPRRVRAALPQHPVTERPHRRPGQPTGGEPQARRHRSRDLSAQVSRFSSASIETRRSSCGARLPRAPHVTAVA